MITLTQGQVAIVDEEDYEKMAKHNWCISGDGIRQYAVRGTRSRILDFQRIIKMHREILGLTDPTICVDHINHNGLDNRKDNLRLCSISQNGFNKIKQLRPTSSQYKGVSWTPHAKLWRAYIWYRRKRTSLGYFKSEVSAAIAYNNAAINIFGEFAHLNNIKESK